MALTYDNLGVHFLYPENWTIADEQTDDWPRGVSIESPGGAFWSLQIHPLPAETKDLLDTARSALEEEYENAEVVPAQEESDGVALTGYDITFIYLDLIVQVRLRAFRLAARNFVLLYQAEDAEFEKLELVFRALTASLLRGLNAAQTT